MGTIIVAGIIAVICALALKSVIQKKGGCSCGSGSCDCHCKK